MDQIEDYLADLSRRLRVAPRSRDRFLAEIEAHLRDTADSQRAAGLNESDSQGVAITRIGSPGEIAAAANAGAVTGGLAFAAAQLVAVGCTAVLIGVILSRLLARVTSTAWVFGLPTQEMPAESRISHWVQVQPGAHGWRNAAALENASDSLFLRGGLALICLTAALVFILVARPRVGRLAEGTVPMLGLLTFGGAAAVLLVAGLAGVGELDWGRGQWFTDATVALVVAAIYGAERLRHREVAPGG
jgi:hypothetical protein